MAITGRTNPELIVHGQVVSTREIKRAKGENAGEVLGLNATIETPGGKLVIGSWDRNPIPGDHSRLVGSTVAYVVTVEENARGANLTFERVVNDNDLDLIASLTRELAPAK
jgi:hypothetical protein